MHNTHPREIEFYTTQNGRTPSLNGLKRYVIAKLKLQYEDDSLVLNWEILAIFVQLVKESMSYVSTMVQGIEYILLKQQIKLSYCCAVVISHHRKAMSNVQKDTGRIIRKDNNEKT